MSAAQPAGICQLSIAGKFFPCNDKMQLRLRSRRNETPFFKGDQVVGEVMNGEEKAEVEKKPDLKEGRK